MYVYKVDKVQIYTAQINNLSEQINYVLSGLKRLLHISTAPTTITTKST